MDVGLSGGQFENFFPCYLVTNQALDVQRVGRSITKFLPDLLPGDRLDQWFIFDRPVATPDPAALVRDQTPVQIRSIDGRLHLSGCVVEQHFGFLFCLSHSPGRAATWSELGLTVDDFSLADQSLAISTAISLQKTLNAELQETIENLRTARDEAMAASRARGDAAMFLP